MLNTLFRLLLGTLILVIAPSYVFSQNLNCQPFRSGTFVMNDKGNETIIQRTDSSQTEIYNKSTPTSYKVRWTDDCTYILIPEQNVFDKYPNTPKNAQLIVTIISVDKKRNTYKQKCRFNFMNEEFTSEVQKIK